MKTIIAGSRGIIDPDIIQSAIAESGFQITEVVSGCARGVDTEGERWAESAGVPVSRFPPNWEKFGKYAGYYRNAEMAKYAEALIAIWDGQSRGTKHMIDLANTNGIEVFVKKITLS